MKRNYKMLHKLAWSFATTTGQDEKDLFQEAFLAYMKSLETWDYSKSKLTTYAYNCITQHLINYTNKEKIRRTEDLNLVRNKETESNDFLERLSKEGLTILDILMKNADTFLSLTQTKALELLKTKLQEKGWNDSTILKTFEDIKQALS